MPDPALVADLLHRLNRDLDGEEMPHPGLEHPAQGIEPAAGEAEIEHRVVGLVAAPVEVRIAFVQHLQLDAAQGRLRLGNQLAEGAESAGRGVHFHGLGIGRKDIAVLDGDALLAEQQFGRPGTQTVARAVENVPQDDVRHLVEEERRGPLRLQGR